LPQNLSHFAPGQGASKTVGEEQSLASPLAVLEPSCGKMVVRLKSWFHHLPCRQKNGWS